MPVFSAPAPQKKSQSVQPIQSAEELQELFSLTIQTDGQGEIFTFYRKGVSAGQAGDFEKAWAICYDTAFFFDDSKGLESLADFLRDGLGVEQDIQKAMAVYTYTATVLKAGNGWAMSLPQAEPKPQ